MSDGILAKMMVIPASAPTTNSGNDTPAASSDFDYNKWLATAPQEVREAHAEGISSLREQREQLVGRITTNSTGVWTAETLAAFDLPTLRRIAATCKPAPAPAATQNSNFRHMMFGAGPVPTQNAGGEVTTEPLLTPTWGSMVFGDLK
jgi:hypothetical protein